MILISIFSKVSAQELIITQTNGTEAIESLNEIENIILSDGNILLSMASDSVKTYPMENVQKLHFDNVTLQEDISYTKAILYPNPAKERIRISGLKSENSEILIFRPDGSVAEVFNLSVYNNEIDVSNLPQGLYFLQIDETTIKFVKL